MHRISPIKIYVVGKTKERWLQEALDEYLKRMAIEIIVAKDNDSLLKMLGNEQNITLLDSGGMEMTSREFSEYITARAKHTFVIGGFDGLPKGLPYPRLSLSKMTFTHQMVRLFLVEQIYRAFEIEKGSKYHVDN